MNTPAKAAAVIVAMSAGIAAVNADDPTPTPAPSEVKQVAPSAEGQKIEEVKKVEEIKKVDVQATPLTKVNKEIVKPPAAEAVKGIEGLQGAKLENLKKALQLQAHPHSTAAPQATGGKAAAAAAGLLTQDEGLPPPEPAPIVDGRELPILPPSELGGS